MKGLIMMSSPRWWLTNLVYYIKGRRVSINAERFRIPRELLPVFSLKRDNAYEPVHVELVRRLLRQGECFVDVGANVGVFSAVAGRIVGERGMVIAFEPNPFIFPLLVELVRLNGLAERVHPLPLAASDTNAVVEFCVVPEWSPLMSRSGLLRKDARERLLLLPSLDLASREHQQVSVRTMATTLDRSLMGVPRIDWIKIDVEGAELDVLAGAREVLNKRPIVSLEVHGLHFKDKRDVIVPVFDRFRELDCECWNPSKGGRETLEGFSANTGVPGRDPLTGEAYGRRGYGHLIFAGREHAERIDGAMETLVAGIGAKSGCAQRSQAGHDEKTGPASAP